MRRPTGGASPCAGWPNGAGTPRTNPTGIMLPPDATGPHGPNSPLALRLVYVSGLYDDVRAARSRPAPRDGPDASAPAGLPARMPHESPRVWRYDHTAQLYRREDRAQAVPLAGPQLRAFEEAWQWLSEDHHAALRTFVQNEPITLTPKKERHASNGRPTQPSSSNAPPARASTCQPARSDIAATTVLSRARHAHSPDVPQRRGAVPSRLPTSSCPLPAAHCEIVYEFPSKR